MEKIEKLSDIKREICFYLIREKQAADLSEIKKGLNLPSLFWAEYYVTEMMNQGILTEEKGKYDIVEKIKPDFVLFYFRDYNNKTIKRFTLYLSLCLTLFLTFIVFIFYLPKSILTYELYSLTFMLIAIFIITIEIMNHNKYKIVLGD